MHNTNPNSNGPKEEEEEEKKPRLNTYGGARPKLPKAENRTQSTVDTPRYGGDLRLRSSKSPSPLLIISRYYSSYLSIQELAQDLYTL